MPVPAFTRYAAAGLSLVIAIFILIPSGLADGRVFHRGTAVIDIPDQEALIHYAGGVETLVIETRFVPPAGAPEASSMPDAAAYAWVVPVPGPRAGGVDAAADVESVPEVFSVTTGTFPTLRALCAPRLDRGIWDNWSSLIITCVLLVVILSIKASIRRRAAIKVTGCVLVLLVGAVLLMPTLGYSRAGVRAGGRGVEVLDRSLVGSYDVAIVGVENAAAADELLAWLTAEGFVLPPDAKATVADYARLGWVFVAAKIRQGHAGEAGPLTPHPLGIRFRAAQAVYPMRLTAVGDRPLALGLYVFADKQAVVRGMKTVRCALCGVGAPSSASWRDYAHPEYVSIIHRQIASLVGAASVVTKLSARLTPRQMQRDLAIGWKEATPFGGLKYSTHGAATVAADWLGCLWLVGIVVVCCLAPMMKWSGGRVARLSAAVLAPCLLASLAIGLALPVVPSVAGDGRLWYRGRLTRTLMEQAVVNVEGAIEPGASLEDVRQRVADQIRKLVDSEPSFHDSLPSAPVHEDSPMNYVIREGRDRAVLEFVLLDDHGHEEVFDWIPAPHR